MPDPIDVISEIIRRHYFAESVHLVDVMLDKSQLWQPAASSTLPSCLIDNSCVTDVCGFRSGFPCLRSVQSTLRRQLINSDDNGLLGSTDPTDLIMKEPNMGVSGGLKSGRLPLISYCLSLY